MDLVREFVVASLDAAGGVVDEAPGGVHALLPAAAAQALGLTEEVRIAFSAATGDAPAVIDGRLGSPLVERLATRRLAAPPVAAIVLAPELPRPLPEHLPVLLNAVRSGEVRRTREAHRYLVATLRLAVQSDEVRSALDSVGLRLADGACVPPLPLERGEPHALRGLDEDELGRSARGLRRWLKREGPRRLAGAVEAVGRRVRRDLERMAEFYASLDEEMAASGRRARSADERARRTAKRAALPDDLQARRAQLRERMRPRLSAALVTATLVETDAERFDLPVRRRSRDGVVTVLCRAADSMFEGPACAACGVAALRLYLCDERLHVLCDACGRGGRLDAARCPVCRRPSPTPLRLSLDDPTEAVRTRLAAPRDEARSP